MRPGRQTNGERHVKTSRILAFSCAGRTCRRRHRQHARRRLRPGRGRTRDQPGRHRLDAGLDGAGAADDAGAGVLLRRAGALEERAQHDDDELRRARRSSASPGRCVGYSLAFAPGQRTGRRTRRRACLRGVGLEAQGTIPHVLFMAYQGTFAIITAALISGAIVERMRFGAYLAVHRALGARRLRAGRALGLGRRLAGQDGRARLRRRHRRARQRRRRGAGGGAWCSARARTTRRQAILPHNVPFTLLGAGLLWFGWFGFNAGSALAANASAALAFTNTLLAPTATLVVWTLLDLDAQRQGRPRSAPPPASSSAWSPSRRRPASSARWARIAARRASPRSRATSRLVWRARTRLDDSLDVVAAHGVGGTVGALLTGVFAEKAWNGATDGLLVRQPGAARHPGGRRAAPRSSTAASRTFVLLKLVGAGDRRCAPTAATKASAWTSASTAKRRTRTAKARSWCCPTWRRRRVGAAASWPSGKEVAHEAHRCDRPARQAERRARGAVPRRGQRPHHQPRAGPRRRDASRSRPIAARR